MRLGFLVAFLCLSVSCSSRYNREKLADKQALAEHIEDNIKFSGDAQLYKDPKHKIKTVGIIGMSCSHIIQDSLESYQRKYTYNNTVTTTTHTLTAGVNNQNLYLVCNLMEETFAKKLEAMGYTVKRTAEMKLFPTYSKLGSASQGVGISGIQRNMVAQDGNNYLSSLPSFSTDDDWANGLAKEAGVDALVWAMSSSSWGLEGKSKQGDLEGVTFRVDPRTMFFMVVPYDRCKAAGGCGGWVANNGPIATTQEFDYSMTLFMPKGDSEEVNNKIIDAWTKYADEQVFLLGMHMTKFEQEMND